MKTILKGMWIGATMTVPGVSGGTMAVVIGIYEDLIAAVNGLFKNPLKHIGFLLKFVAGAFIGFIFFAKWITFLLSSNNFGEIIRFLFMGIVIGGIPLLVNKSGIKKINLSSVFSVISGAVCVMFLSLIPVGVFNMGNGLVYLIKQFFGGIIVAIALILPGISVSHMLYILGMYEVVLEKVYTFKFLELIPLAVGVIAGCIFTAGILEKILKKYTCLVYMVIIGFVAGSVVSLFPKGGISNIIADIIFLVIGFVGMYMFSMHNVDKSVK